MNVYITYSRNLPLNILIIFVLGVFSTSGNASELDVEQGGKRGKIDITFKYQNAKSRLNTKQYGLENMLDLTIGADINATIMQDGQHGSITIDTQKPNNTLEVNQGGASNSLNALLLGSSNTSKIGQKGDHNSLTMTLTGTNNTLSINQSNSNNSIDLMHRGSGNIFNLIQTGFNNSLSINTHQSGLSIDIEQSGSGQTMSLHN